MRVLALETSQRQATLAALDYGEVATDEPRAAVLEFRELPQAERTARSLVPAIGEVLAGCNWQPAELDLICTSTGPGSFTGLRLGVTTAKTLAYATGAALVGVPTLAAIAAAAGLCAGRLWTVLDAQRQELFAACFSVTAQAATPRLPGTCTVSIEAWLDQLHPGDSVSGPPLAKLIDRLPAGVVVTPVETWAPRAVEVGELGIAAWCRGEVVDPIQLVPEYFRRSAAEEHADL